jgi:hypothetical protein
VRIARRTEIDRGVLVLLAVCLSCALACNRKEESAPAPVQEPPPAPSPTATEPAATAQVSAPGPVAELPVISATPPPGVVPGQWVTSRQCNIEAIDDAHELTQLVPVKAAAPLTLRGWAYVDASKKPPDSIAVRFAAASGSEYYAVTKSGIARDDVQKAKKLDPAAVGTGFEMSAPASQLSPGEYSMQLILRATDKTYICDNGRRIRVEL